MPFLAILGQVEAGIGAAVAEVTTGAQAAVHVAVDAPLLSRVPRVRIIFHLFVSFVAVVELEWTRARQILSRTDPG